MFGNQPPTGYSTSTSQPQPVPFTPEPQYINTPPPTDAITGYGLPVQQPTTYPTVPQQQAMPPWAMERAGGYNMPVQQLPYTPPPLKPKSRKPLIVLLIVLFIVFVVVASGVGIAAYMLTRPQPVMSVTSTYMVSSIPAGSTNTVLHVSARSFSGSSAITFLLDNTPIANGQNVASDTNGNVRADLTVTTAWTVGNHTLTAKDANGYTTKSGVTVAVVPQGQAHTPGPNGAPPDDMSFNLKANLQSQDSSTGQQNGSSTQTLIVTGRPDPSGGTVCTSVDNGQPQTYLGNTNNGLTYHETYVASCSGTYQGGKLTYIGTMTSDKVVYSNGVSCIAHTPYVYEHLEGTFTSQNAISGTVSSDSFTADCNQGVGTVQINAIKGSWTGQMS
jgi:hypothetical protein